MIICLDIKSESHNRSHSIETGELPVIQVFQTTPMNYMYVSRIADVVYVLLRIGTWNSAKLK